VMDEAQRLDARVAVEVMGWQKSDEEDYERGWPAGLWWDGGKPRSSWSPTTDIAQAWEVVEEMVRKGWWLFLEYDHNIKRYLAAFSNGVEETPMEDCTTAPLAICEAALAAGEEGER
jgi:hypothetical protein